MLRSLLLRPSLLRLNHQEKYIQHTSSRLSAVGIHSTERSCRSIRQPNFRFFSTDNESSSSESSASAGPSSGGESRLHSTDIAFKPAESGWGSGTKYSQNYDNIFSKKKKIKTEDRDKKLTKSTNDSDEN